VREGEGGRGGREREQHNTSLSACAAYGFEEA